VGTVGCPRATRLLQDLHDKIAGISEDVLLMDESHPLVGFSGDPTSFVSPELDNWEGILNPIMCQASGYNTTIQNPDMFKGLA